MHLAVHDPDWPVRAAAEAQRWRDDLAPGLIAAHHIGSTSVSGLSAKPILDLLPVFASARAADAAAGPLRARGYECLGAFGLPGRRYARLDDPGTGARLVQAHGYVAGHPDIARHLAFRDALRADPALAAEYQAIKAQCAARHGFGAEYSACKGPWIARVEARALASLA